MTLSQTSARRAIYRIAWRHAWRRPLQSLFLIAGVAIGVAMIVAIDLANGSAERAFALGTETVAGRATHAIIGGPSGLDEQVYADLRADTGFRLSAPVVEGYLIVEELDRQVGVITLLDRALFENDAVFGHFFGLLLAHGPA